jgi:hypothetical protein
MEDFTDVLDAVQEGEAVTDIGDLTHKLCLLIMTEAMEGRIDAKRLANRSTPMQLAGSVARFIQEELTKEV